MQQTKNSLKKATKFAGLLYLIPAIMAINGSMHVASKNMVCKDTGATANNMLANEVLYPRCIISKVIAQVVFVCSRKTR